MRAARRFLIANQIQSREYSRDGGTDGRSHIVRDPNGNRNSFYLYWNDGKWNWNYNWLDNNRNDNNPSAVLANLFISPPAARGSFV